jgi:hypothetical protein
MIHRIGRMFALPHVENTELRVSRANALQAAAAVPHLFFRKTCRRFLTAMAAISVAMQQSP